MWVRSGVGRKLALASISVLPGKYHEASKGKGAIIMTALEFHKLGKKKAGS